MCGIAGIFDWTCAVDRDALAAMGAILAYRGPDGSGTHGGDGIGLTQRRLAIVDVEHGVQPVSDETRTILAVFNGEIYNHRALREQLARRGHTFRSHSDSEVIPHLYEEHGTGFVDLLDGDFAIALWDGRKRSLLLARDRVGVKPLFYHLGAQRLLFASEVKGLFASGMCDAAVDPQGLRDVFFYGQAVAPGTFWRGVADLPPGHVMTVREGGIVQLRRYFTPLEIDSDEPLLNGPAALARFRETFTEAVRKRIPDEVGYGATLSGGVDSTAVVSVLRHALGVTPTTSSLRLPGERLDEGPHSRQAARYLDVPNIEVEIDGRQACELLPRTLWHLESPQWFGVATPFLKLTAQARELGVTVALTGDGADELLGGYSWYVLQKLERRLRGAGLGGLRKLLYHQLFRWTDVPDGAAAHMLDVPRQLADPNLPFGGGSPAWFYLWSAMDTVTAPLLRPAVGDLPPSPLPPAPAHSPLHQAMHYEFHTRLPQWVLVLSDRLSMANGVEVRVPFMDRELLDLSARLHPDMLMRGLREKHVLKQSLRDVLPPGVRRRRKKPFFTPITPWYLTGPGRDLAGTYLGADAVRQAGLFDPQEVALLHRVAVAEAGRTWAGSVAEWASMAVLTTHVLLDQFAHHSPALA